jgi:hypothetical protein
MKERETLQQRLDEQGVSRRAFLKFCAAMATLMALPPGSASAIAAALSQAKRPSVIWLSFQGGSIGSRNLLFQGRYGHQTIQCATVEEVPTKTLCQAHGNGALARAAGPVDSDYWYLGESHQAGISPIVNERCSRLPPRSSRCSGNSGYEVLM